MTLRNRIFTTLIFLFCLVTRNGLTAQKVNLVQQEAKMVKLYGQLFSRMGEEYDTMEVYSQKFEKAFIDLIRKNPSTLSYSFKKLMDSNFCFIKTSDDGNFRYYSWDTWTGGTMHVFKEVIQWKSNNKVYTQVVENGEGDSGYFCSGVMTVMLNNKPHYLAIRNAIYSNKEAMQSIYAYTLNNNKLNDSVKIFKTKTKYLNHIDVSFDFFSVVDHPERPLELIQYDSKKKVLYIPVVDENGQVTKKNLQYVLKDPYLVFTGIESSKK